MTTVEKRADELIRRLTEDDDTEHLDYEALAAYVDGHPSAEARRHVALCPTCAQDVDDLWSAATKSPLWTRWYVWAGAAAILVAVFFYRTSPKPTLDLHDGNVDPAIARTVLERGTLEIAPAALALRESHGTLMGNTPSKFDVLAPVATYVRTTRPQFIWTPLADAHQYRVEVYDEARQLVLASPMISTTSWMPSTDLARGRDYIWQVVADDRAPAPAPPAPPARFGVLGADAVARIDAAAQRYRGSHLMLAIAAAREGALDEARAELAVLQQMNPRSSAVTRLVRALGPQ